MRKLNYILPLFLLTACSNSSEPPVQEFTPGETPSFTQLVSDNSAVTTGTLNNVSVHGEIKCTGRIDIPPTDVISAHARTTGFISAVNFIQGDHVNNGVVIAQIENPEFIPRQRELLELKLQLDLAQKQLDRQNTLESGGATTSKVVEEALNNRDILKARYEGLREELKALGFNIENLENNNEFQRVLNIYAPTNGIVESVDVNMGKLVHPDDRIMRIVNYHHIHLELQVFSRDSRNVKIGQMVAFYIPGSDIAYDGEIVKISPSINPESGTFMVHCHIEDEATIEIVKPGLFVNATIFTGEKTIYGLPKDAVVKEGSLYYAYLVKGDNVEKTLLEGVQEYAEYYAFRVPETLRDAQWVTGGAYYIQ